MAEEQNDHLDDQADTHWPHASQGRCDAIGWEPSHPPMMPCRGRPRLLHGGAVAGGQGLPLRAMGGRAYIFGGIDLGAPRL